MLLSGSMCVCVCALCIVFNILDCCIPKDKENISLWKMSSFRPNIDTHFNTYSTLIVGVNQSNKMNDIKVNLTGFQSYSILSVPEGLKAQVIPGITYKQTGIHQTAVRY